MRNLARGAFFLSGIAGLTFEIVWVRHLGLALGATTLAIATTTAAYMGGLAVGSHFGGRLADRLRRPLAVYGAIEMVIGALGLVVPWLCTRLPAWNAFLFDSVESGTATAMWRFVMAFAVLIVPTVAMGATLPILARAVTDRVAQVGSEVGMLYALNITGAMLGAGLCGFWWIPTLGLAATNAVAVGLDLALGVVALGVGLRQPARSAATAPQQPGGVGVPSIWRSGGTVLVTLLGVTGAAAMALQVLWTRALGTALGPSTYAFSAIVCAYLGGLALGSTVASRVADRVSAVRLALAVALLVTGLFCLVGITWVDDLPELLRGVVLDRGLTMEGLVRTEFLLAALSVLPATVGMGALFPLTLSAVVGSDERLGLAVGRAYAINTAGAIVGCFAAVFLLLPLFGVENSMRAAALAYAVAALVLCARLEPSVLPAVRYSTAGLGVALGVAIVAWPHWNVGRWTAGLYRLSMTRAYYADGSFEPSQVIFHHDGLAATVTVEEESGVRWVKVNGKIDGSNQGDMPTQVLSGLLPMMLARDNQEVAVIGCGSCVTVGAALQAGPRHITLIEMEQQVVRAAHLFSDVNHAPWDNPNVTIIEDDGRNFLSRRGDPYDVIVSEPSNPWMTGSASLFTVEFFKLAQARLKDSGLFVQWLQVYELAPQRIASVLKTFHAVFPHVLVFSAHTDSNDLLLVGSTQPPEPTFATLQKRFGAYHEELARADLQAAEDLLALLLFDEREIEKLGADVDLNTDDNALIEFGAPRDLLAFAEEDPTFPLLDQVKGRRAAQVRRMLGDDSTWPSTLASLSQGYLRQGMLDEAQRAVELLREPGTQAREEDVNLAQQTADIATLLAEADDRERVVDTASIDANHDFSRALRMYVDGDEAGALAYLEERPSMVRQSGKRLLFYGYLLYREEQYSAARKMLLRARGADDTAELRPAITYYLARNAYNEGDYKRAVQEMQQYRATVAPASRDLKVED